MRHRGSNSECKWHSSPRGRGGRGFHRCPRTEPSLQPGKAGLCGGGGDGSLSLPSSVALPALAECASPLLLGQTSPVCRGWRREGFGEVWVDGQTALLRAPWGCSWEMRLMDGRILHRAGSAPSGAFLASRQQSRIFSYPDCVLVWAAKRICA